MGFFVGGKVENIGTRNIMQLETAREQLTTSNVMFAIEFDGLGINFSVVN